MRTDKVSVGRQIYEGRFDIYKIFYMGILGTYVKSGNKGILVLNVPTYLIYIQYGSTYLTSYLQLPMPLYG